MTTDREYLDHPYKESPHFEALVTRMTVYIRKWEIEAGIHRDYLMTLARREALATYLIDHLRLEDLNNWLARFE